MNSHLVTAEELVEEPYSSVLGYPKCTRDELENRVRELRSIGIKVIIFEGNSKIGKLEIIGKGCVSVVVKAVVDGRAVALKIRRLDADRESMEREANLLKIANSVDVGPRFIASNKNFLAMDIADGRKIIEWIRQRPSAEQIRSVTLKVLEQCFRLDTIGLDHGELSNLNKHVIVGKNPTIIDFESASTERRISNVTAAAQCLFIGGEIARRIRKMLAIDSSNKIIQELRKYKNDPSKENLESLIKTLNLL